jgi:hypothetical protein
MRGRQVWYCCRYALTLGAVGCRVSTGKVKLCLIGKTHAGQKQAVRFGLATVWLKMSVNR